MQFPVYRRTLKETIIKTRQQLGEPPIEDWTEYDAETERLEPERAARDDQPESGPAGSGGR